MVFGESCRVKKLTCHSRQFMLNEEMIEEVTHCSHVGIMLNSYCDNTECIRNYVSKMRRGLMKIVGKGVRIPGSGVCCKTSLLKVYKSVVLPCALYGAELWTNLTKSNGSQLERGHTFCLKYI